MYAPFMASESFSKAEKEAKENLKGAVRRLNECYREQANLTKQIADLRSVIAAFARMRNEEFVEEDEFGMTDAIRLVLASCGGGLNPEGVKKAIYDIGVDTDNYENVMAAIGTALKRLCDQRQVRMSKSLATGKIYYFWNSGPVPLKSLMTVGNKKEE
jgi:hypothetical protein